MILLQSSESRIGLFVLVMVITFGLLSGCTAKKESELEYSELKFEKKRWVKAREEEEWSVRSGMAKNLINQKIILDKSRTEIIEMLDDPEDVNGDAQNLNYLIRRDHDSDIDPVRIEYLKIVFNENGKAGDASIVTYRSGKATMGKAMPNNSFNRSGNSSTFIDNLDASCRFFPPG